MILLEWRLVLGPNSCTPSSEYLREAEIFLQSQLTNKTVAQLSDSTFLQKSVCQLWASWVGSMASCYVSQHAQITE